MILRIRTRHVLLMILLLSTEWVSLRATPNANTVSQETLDMDGSVIEDSLAEGDDVKLPQHCHSWTGASCDWEPNLHEMTVQYGNGIYNESFHAYITPDVSTFYNETIGSKRAAKPSFTGQFGKFTNLSPDSVRVYWDSGRKGDTPLYIADIAPFGSAGTATYPTHMFIVTPPNDIKKILTTWTMEPGNCLYYYDPFDNNPEKAKKALTADQFHMYHIQIQNRAFAHQYRQFTRTDWLALYKHKNPPRYHMWRADFFDQIHTITTEEIHYTEMPPDEELKRGTSVYGPRPDEIARMRRFRHQEPSMELQLKVLSCAPRVFEIRNFLSDVEVDHILQIANSTYMARSSTKAGEAARATSSDTTRTSKNTWISRNHDMILDAIHRRAADVLQIPEALLRWRRKSEIPEFTENLITIAEKLQLVHYDVGQQYTAHHDFSMPSLVHGQPSRFATILFYLNDDMEGGETSFPRWLNAETREELAVKPERGKAILFYSMLPDGNYDERSQHAALPVLKGEKYLINLWVWDPVLDHAAPRLTKRCKDWLSGLLPFTFVSRICSDVFFFLGLNADTRWRW